MGSLPARTQKKGWGGSFANGSSVEPTFLNPHPNSMLARLKRAERKALLQEKTDYENDSKAYERDLRRAQMDR